MSRPPLVLGAAERAHYERQRVRIDHRLDLRCGICDEPIAPGARTVKVDGERCHEACAAEDSDA